MFSRTLLLVVIACLSWAPRALSENPDPGKTALKEAEELESKGTIPNAITKYKQALEGDPYNDSIQARLLCLYCKSASNSRLDPDLHLHLGQALQFVGDYIGAEEQYKTAVLLSIGKRNAEAERLLAALSRLRGQRDCREKLDSLQSNGLAPNTSNRTDFDPYMSDLQRRIKAAWLPPRDYKSERVEVQFKVDQSGEVVDEKISKSSGIAAADKAALEAIVDAAPFPPPPGGVNGVTDIKFTFDYNVLGTPISSEGDNDFYEIPRTPPSDEVIGKLDLSQSRDLRLAESYAIIYTRSGNLIAARKLYQRISAALQSSKTADRNEMTAVRAALARMNLFIATDEAMNKTSLVPLVIACLRQLSDTDSFAIDRTTTVRLERQLLADIVRCKVPFCVIADALYCRPGIGIRTKLSFTKLLYDASVKNGDTQQHVEQLSQYLSSYRRTIENLVIADELERRAFKFECGGSYELALKLYREALAMKERDPGNYSEEALIQSGDVGRVLAAQGHVLEAEKAYEEAIASFKKAGIKGDGYVMILENYGDMLNRANQNRRANAVYAEATAIAEKNGQ
jgi:TonB family protein